MFVAPNVVNMDITRISYRTNQNRLKECVIMSCAMNDVYNTHKYTLPLAASEAHNKMTKHNNARH